MLHVANLSKEYPTVRGPLTVLTDVSFTLAAGDAAAVMGPSGSGKSSLLYVLGALEPPTSGNVFLEGRPISSLSRKNIARILKPVFQDPYSSLNPRETVEDAPDEAQLAPPPKGR